MVIRSVNPSTQTPSTTTFTSTQPATQNQARRYAPSRVVAPFAPVLRGEGPGMRGPHSATQAEIFSDRFPSNGKPIAAQSTARNTFQRHAHRTENVCLAELTPSVLALIRTSQTIRGHVACKTHAAQTKEAVASQRPHNCQTHTAS